MTISIKLRKTGATVAIFGLVASSFGIVMFPQFALAAVETRDAGTGTNVDRSSGPSWSNPGNITTALAPFTTVSLGNSASDYLQATNYGFNIPTNATIKGIQVTINRQSNSNNSGQSIHDDVVQLIKGGVITGGDKATSADWPTTLGQATYGAVNDLWGTTWTPAQINASNFGVALSIESESNQNRTGTVDYIQVTVTYLEVAANPTLSNSCGLDITLVIDSSGSIDSTELTQMKNALKAFVDAFIPGTPTEFSVVNFDDTATILQAFTGNATLVKNAISAPLSGGSTNWKDALVKAHSTFSGDRADHLDLVVFASDGNPNVPGTATQALEDAIVEANAIKGDGIRIITLGIGNDLSTTNLEKISSVEAVFTGDFSTLAADLSAIASELCGGTITIKKVVDADGSLGTTDDQTAVSGWSFDVSGTPADPSPVQTGANGFTPSISVDPGTYSVTETVQSGYQILSGSCKIGDTVVGTFGTNAVSGIAIGSNDIVSCVFINHQNVQPVITLLGVNPVNLLVGDTYTEAGATASDLEDGDISANVVIGGSVNTGETGSYQLTYNVSDSQGFAADTVTRTVNVSNPPSECSDGIDNDGDGTFDFDGEEADSGCENADDNNENLSPVINLIGANPLILTLGSIYSELGATANDPEDGNGLTVSDIDASDVDTDVVGSYSVFYNFTDLNGADAPEVTRTVEVKTACTDGLDNDGDTLIDSQDPGCDSENPEDNSENTPPSINLIGDALINLVQFMSFTDPGATVTDTEDSPDPALVVGGDSVNTGIPGTYVITYDATDDDGANATQVSRSVVVSAAPVCSDNLDNDEDNLIDENDPGCHTDGNVENSESYDGNRTSENDPTPVTQCSNGTDDDSDSLVDLLDPGCENAQDNNETNSITPLTPPTPPGPETPTGNGLPGAVTFGGGAPAVTQGQVLGESCSLYITKYMRIGRANDPEEVKKLQIFLNDYMNAGLPVSGFFGALTFNAVNAFQLKEGSEVLAPWVNARLHSSVNEPTGYVYKTTLRRVNLIKCVELAIPMPQLP